MVLGIVLCSVSWVIVSMFLLCFGGLLFWEWVPNTCTGGTAEMTFKEAVEIMDEFVDRFGWLATPAHGTLPDRALSALSVLKEQADLYEKVVELTREALHSDDPEKIRRITWDFENIVQCYGYSLPVQKMFLLWESKKISDDRMIIFLEDCYRWANELEDVEKAKELRDETTRWTIQMLWKVTRPNR